jgi:hypothetical protein
VDIEHRTWRRGTFFEREVLATILKDVAGYLERVATRGLTASCILYLAMHSDQSWIESQTLKLICRHTVNVAAGIISTLLVGRLIEFLPPGTVRTFLKDTDEFLLAALVICFVIEVLIIIGRRVASLIQGQTLNVMA